MDEGQKLRYHITNIKIQITQINMSGSARNNPEYIDDYRDSAPPLAETDTDTDDLEGLFDGPDDLDESIEDLTDRTFEPGDQLYFQGELFEVSEVWSMDDGSESEESDLLHDQATLPKFAEPIGGFSLSIPDSDLKVEHLPAILITPLEEGTGTAEPVVVYETAEIQRVY